MMRQEIERDEWQSFLDDFTERNRWRTARLEISGLIGKPWTMTDLPFVGVRIRTEGDGAPWAEFSFAGGGQGAPTSDRTVRFVREVLHGQSVGGRSEVLEIHCEGGVRALLYLSSQPDTTAA